MPADGLANGPEVFVAVEEDRVERADSNSRNSLVQAVVVGIERGQISARVDPAQRSRVITVAGQPIFGNTGSGVAGRIGTRGYRTVGDFDNVGPPVNLTTGVVRDGNTSAACSTEEHRDPVTLTDVRNAIARRNGREARCGPGAVVLSNRDCRGKIDQVVVGRIESDALVRRNRPPFVR